VSRVSAILVIIALLLGSMIGYSFAFVRFYKEAQEKAEAQSALEGTTQELQQELTLPTSPSASFGQVIWAHTEKAVIPLDSVCEPTLTAISNAAEATLSTFNAPNSPLIGLSRINEASRFFEDKLRELLDQHPHLSCQIPQTQEGNTQRTGYPDLEITHHPTGRVFYLDPKLYETSSRESTLRSFYYTPRNQTSKVLKPAHHLLIGFSHNGEDGHWQFESWSLVDLSKVELTLKSEYNASNRELYQETTIVRSSK